MYYPGRTPVAKPRIVTPKKKLFYDISASAVQMLVTQLSGAVIFYLLSNYLSKPDIGHINWSLAVLMIIYAILGCGLDQLTVRKIAMGADPVTLLKPYLVHLLLMGGCLAILLLLTGYYLPVPGNGLRIFLLLAVSQFLLFLSLPFKQVANGLERFRVLLAMSVVANSIRVAGLIVLILVKTVSVNSIICLYILSSLLELITCLLLYTRSLQLPVRLQWNKGSYTTLIKESLPQLGVIFFNTAIARFDWVLLGLLSSAVVVADYSFTYRFFELATLPLLILGPLLLPRISRIFGGAQNSLPANNNRSIIDFAQIEMVIAVLTILVINICWTPVIDLITHGKYGSNNAVLLFILSLCIPFLYINNVLWSLAFAQGKLKEILRVFMITFCVNIAADLLLIPFYQSKGAATGFVLAIAVQTFFYLKKTSLSHYSSIFSQLAINLFVAGAGYYCAVLFCDGLFAKLFCSTGIYLFILLVTKKINFRNGFLLTGLSKI